MTKLMTNDPVKRLSIYQQCCLPDCTDILNGLDRFPHIGPHIDSMFTDLIRDFFAKECATFEVLKVSTVMRERYLDFDTTVTYRHIGDEGVLRLRVEHRIDGNRVVSLNRYEVPA